MTAPAVPPTTAPMMAPRAVDPVLLPMIPPTVAPATVPMTAPFSLRLADAQAADTSRAATSTVLPDTRALARVQFVILIWCLVKKENNPLGEHRVEADRHTRDVAHGRLLIRANDSPITRLIDWPE